MHDMRSHNKRCLQFIMSSQQFYKCFFYNSGPGKWKGKKNALKEIVQNSKQGFTESSHPVLNDTFMHEPH